MLYYKNKVKEKTAHYSQKDYSTGFGGKFGVMKDRQGNVNTYFKFLINLIKINKSINLIMFR